MRKYWRRALARKCYQCGSMSPIPQWTCHMVHISVLNGALWDIGKVHCRICEFDLLETTGCEAAVIRFKLCVFCCHGFLVLSPIRIVAQITRLLVAIAASPKHKPFHFILLRLMQFAITVCFRTQYEQIAQHNIFYTFVKILLTTNIKILHNASLSAKTYFLLVCAKSRYTNRNQR